MRLTRLTTAVLAIHADSSRPKPIIGVQWPSTSGAISAEARLTPNAQRSLRASSIAVA